MDCFLAETQQLIYNTTGFYIRYTNTTLLHLTQIQPCSQAFYYCLFLLEFLLYVCKCNNLQIMPVFPPLPFIFKEIAQINEQIFKARMNFVALMFLISVIIVVLFSPIL